MEEAPPPSASPPPDRALPVRQDDDGNDGDNEMLSGNGNGSGSGSESGNGNKDAGAGADARGGWSDDVLEVVSVLGEGASGAVQAVRDTRTGRRYARKAIATHEGPLKQLARGLVFLAGLRHTHIVRFYGAYMNPSNTEVKLVMELCEGRSLATIGEEIRRRKGRVGEKVARVLAEGVRALFLSSLFFLFLAHRLSPLAHRVRHHHVSIGTRFRIGRSCKASRTCILRRSSTGTSSPRTSSFRGRV
jgi:serine/threonine protein kinase